jgi:small-conductance mechanosensitive channel
MVQSLAIFTLILWPLRLLRGISRHRFLVRRRLERVLGVLAVVLWAMLLFGQLGLLGPLQSVVGRLLGAGVSVGALSVSVGNVMAFALTVWISFLLARLVNFFLQEDVFTRVHTGRGVPYAISGLVRYTLIFLGLLAGLAAAGVELTKLTVIAGGLGVGIGFGLQNTVNNFLSGLILLFERPIQMGDSVQLPDVWGEIKRIGIRASVIHTFDGAEVIVPNGMLISDKVTNWTLSDRRRRVEVDVGVEYGTPAQRVIDLLVGVAKANPNVLPDPAPKAFFVNFGDSALEFKLRAWSELADAGYAIRSELAVAVQEALEHAGIGVPFPQRDLHIKSEGPLSILKDNPQPVAKDPQTDEG